MHVRRHADATEFLLHAEARLSLAEAENNLVLGVALRQRDDAEQTEPPSYWATVADDNSVIGCAFRTPPHQLGLSRMPVAAIPPLVDDVGRVYSSLPGVTGPANEAECFAQRWAARYRVPWVVTMRQQIHLLTAVTYPPDPPLGTLRLADDADSALLREWVIAFVEETEIPRSGAEFAQHMLSARRMYVWEHRGPRCMVAAARDTPSGACLNAVYTPPQYRRRGYASIAVATLSARLLAHGRAFCCLYTDSGNPTSNSVYRRIGYRPVRDDVDIAFG